MKVGEPSKKSPTPYASWAKNALKLTNSDRAVKATASRLSIPWDFFFKGREGLVPRAILAAGSTGNKSAQMFPALLQ